MICYVHLTPVGLRISLQLVAYSTALCPQKDSTFTKMISLLVAITDVHSCHHKRCFQTRRPRIRLNLTRLPLCTQTARRHLALAARTSANTSGRRRLQGSSSCSLSAPCSPSPFLSSRRNAATTAGADGTTTKSTF